MPQLERLSEAAPVNMTDYWHDIASLEHFWIRRRFEVFCRMVGSLHNMPQPVADIGCGRGLLQRQVEDHFDIGVDGYDLAEAVLLENISRRSRVCLYNIHDCLDSLYQAYGSIFLFDVLEHIDDQNAFLKSALYHLRPGGLLFVNLPAFMHLYSPYDTMAGHIRRYTVEGVASLAKDNGLEVVVASYWGSPYYPLLLLRRLMLAAVKSEKRIVERGFMVKSHLMNEALHWAGKLEFLPQCLLGTSVMAVLRKP